MHPDKKVGLALGILLIGITGAFFFRNDAQLRHEETLTLTDPESLDRKVSQKPGAPYFPEESSPEIVEQPSLSSVPESFASDVLPEVDSSGYRGIVPAPIRNDDGQGDSEYFADRTAPLPTISQDLDRLDQVVPERSASDGLKVVEEPSASESEYIRHTVVAGDNLSKLAEKYLGSHTKYLTLYEANRDLLASPNDLTPGMELKVPTDAGEVKSASPKPESGVSKSNTSQGNGSVVGQRSQPAFVKPDHESIIALGGGRRKAGSLSQVPPPGLPRVEGLNPGSDPAIIASRPE